MNDEGSHKDPGAHPVPRGVLMDCGCGGYVDLSNMPANGVTLARVSLDTSLLRNPMVKLDFSCVLAYTLNMLEELDLVFTLVRQGEDGDAVSLASWPYKVLMDQDIPEGGDYALVILEKNESFVVGFCDSLKCGGCYTYSVRVEVNYFNITAASVNSAFISAIARSGC